MSFLAIIVSTLCHELLFFFINSPCQGTIEDTKSSNRLVVPLYCLSTMKAAVIHTPGGPEVLRLEDIPTPVASPGQVLIRVRAFGLNRSELFTRQGHSPSVQFPRVLGIEAVGIVAAAPGGEFQEGDIVATAMGGLGRDFDGGYAEYTCVSAHNVQAIPRDVADGLDWNTLGAMLEML